MSTPPQPLDGGRPTTYGLVVLRLLLIAALLLPCAAHADDGAIGPSEDRVDAPTDQVRVYVYVDSEGQLHFVDRIDLVPAQYRSTVRETSLVSSPTDHEEALRRAAKKRRDARALQAQEARRQEAAARLQARDAAAARAAEDPDAASERPPTRAERLADALTERRAVLEELVALEEGYAEDEDQAEAELVARSEFLEERLADLDAQVKGLREKD